jgi:asparagine synthase (glutamine-hydrolysing)
LKRLFSEGTRERLASVSAIDTLLGKLPEDFARWTPLAQDQYTEIRTLLSGYLLSSQGDRMLMANSVEGRFPFLDRQVAALAESLPAEYKLRVLDEKHVLKRAAAGLVPPSILNRKKQPYRAPDALSFSSDEAQGWIAEVASPAALEHAGVFNATAAAGVIAKCRARAASGQFSNSDNMAATAVLSTQLVYHHFIRQQPRYEPPPFIRTIVDRLNVPVATR